MTTDEIANMGAADPAAEAAETPPETARLIAENAELRTELHMRTAIYDLEGRLVQMGARSPGLLSGAARGMVQLDPTGQPQNLEALADHLRRSYPEQFAAKPDPAQIDAGAGRAPSPPITRETLARMTPEEIRRLDWSSVRAALNEY